MTGNPTNPQFPKAMANRYEGASPRDARVKAVSANATALPSMDATIEHGSETLSTRRERPASNWSSSTPSLCRHHPNAMGTEIATICDTTNQNSTISPMLSLRHTLPRSRACERARRSILKSLRASIKYAPPSL